jgi:hypothetical protein
VKVPAGGNGVQCLHWFWVELVPLTFWLDVLLAVMDVLLAGCYNWTSGMSPKVGCSEPSAMVERIWVGRWFGVEVWGKSSSRCKRCLNHLGGIVEVIFKLKTRWVPDVGTQKLKAMKSRT